MARKAAGGNKSDWINTTQGNEKMLPIREKPMPKGEKKDDSKPATKKFQKGITCFYYKKEGHIKSEYYIKIADEAKKSANTLLESSTT